MRRLLSLLSVMLWVALPTLAGAYTTTPAGALPAVSYREPTTNTDGSTLTDLKETRVYWKLGTGPETAVIVPASALGGGATINKNDILVPVLPCQQATLSVQVTAADLTNNESARTPVTTLLIDRRVECAPGTPGSVIVN